MDDELDTLTELAIAFSLSTWKCPACTYENSDGARVCDVLRCEVLHQSEVIERCTAELSTATGEVERLRARLAA